MMCLSRLFARNLSASVFAFCLATYGLPASAVTMATPNSLQITVKKFELCTDIDCSSAAVLGSGDVTFDIASVSAGTDVGNYAANASIPRGITYRYARLIMSRTFTVEGVAAVPGAGGGANVAYAACYTKTGNPTTGAAEIEDTLADADINYAAAQLAMTPQDVFLEETEFVPGSALVAETYTPSTVEEIFRLPTPLTIAPDTPAPTIAISIDAASAMSFDYRSGTCYADQEPPVIDISIL